LGFVLNLEAESTTHRLIITREAGHLRIPMSFQK